MQWKNVALIGVGLLGGSLGLALRKRRLAATVTGFVRREASVRECERAGAVTRATRDLRRAVEGADLVVFCTPIAQMRPLAERVLPCLAKGAIVTDVGSVKASVVKDLEILCNRAGAHYIGGHPMAGSEKTGVSAARPELFEQAICLVTPTPDSNAQALRRVVQLWRGVGSRVVQLSPALHDELAGRSSHLPYLLAATLAGFVLDPSHPKRQAEFCATGFRDSTRIASGSPEMWRDIALANRTNLTEALDEFVEQLMKLRRALARGDSAALKRVFATAQARRNRWISQVRSRLGE